MTEYEARKQRMLELGERVSILLKSGKPTVKIRVDDLKELVRNHPYLRMMLREDSVVSVIQQYGSTIRTPYGFWETKEGFDEIKRRIIEFLTLNGKPPNVVEFKIKLKLANFYDREIYSRERYQRFIHALVAGIMDFSAFLQAISRP